MSQKEIDRYERETNNKAIDFDGVDGLHVWFNPDDKQRLLIAVGNMKVIVNRDQGLALADGLRDIVEVYLEEK